MDWQYQKGQQHQMLKKERSPIKEAVVIQKKNLENKKNEPV